MWRLDCGRGTLSHLPSGGEGVSANMALALEDVGWGTVDRRMRMQGEHPVKAAFHSA